jgi:hypothetical protein
MYLLSESSKLVLITIRMPAEGVELTNICLLQTPAYDWLH